MLVIPQVELGEDSTAEDCTAEDYTAEDSTAELYLYRRLCGPLVLIDDMIYNYTKSCNKHNQFILWSLLRLDTKILKDACGGPPQARKKKHVIKDRKILIVLSMMTPNNFSLLNFLNF